jgi:hypothetical protein
MSAPHVSAVAAMLLQKYDFNATKAREKLVASATRLKNGKLVFKPC